jgi:hypothetical protein
MTLNDLALLLLYVLVLVIKTCESPDTCRKYGFGDDAKGARWAFPTRLPRVRTV